jgi:hypothetical protein
MSTLRPDLLVAELPSNRAVAIRAPARTARRRPAPGGSSPAGSCQRRQQPSAFCCWPRARAYASRTDTARKTRNHVRQLEALGYTVTLAPAA